MKVMVRAAPGQQAARRGGDEEVIQWVDRAARDFWRGRLGRERIGRGLVLWPSSKTRVLRALMAIALVLSSCSLAGSKGEGQSGLGTSVATETTQASSSVAGPAIPAFSHVFVIMMENRDYSQVIGSSKAPYINQLAAQYGVAGNFHDIVHHSLPNYLAIISGATQGIVGGDCVECTFAAPNLVDQLQQNGKTWKAYAEDLPQTCYNGKSASPSPADAGKPLYVRRHNPFMYFDDITSDPARCGNVVPLSQFSSDLQNGTVPDFVWITPNMLNNMHDGTTSQGDAWLANFVPKILASPAWQDGGVLFLVWDETSFTTGNQSGGHTLALVIAPNAKPGYESDVEYNHYSVLRTIEEAWGLGYLGHSGDANVQPMVDFFK